MKNLLLFISGLMVLAGLCYANQLVAQISAGGYPLSLSEGERTETVFLSFKHPERYGQNQTEIKRKKSLAFASKIEVSVDVMNESFAIKNENLRIWRVGITSENARSLYLVFDQFELPESGRLFIFTPDYSKIIGAFTAANNKTNLRLATLPLPGDSIILEYSQNIDDDEPILRIGELWYDYIGILPGTNMLKDNRFELSGNCNIDINCYDGNNWRKEQRGVCRIIAEGQICSGSMVNNTRFDARPYFLTANHCISSESAAEDMVVVFNYESPYCNGPDGSVEQSISGGSLRATTHHIDFSLLELSSPPLPSYNPYFVGWNVEEEAALQTTTIHHPQGDVKKISKDFHQPVTANYGGSYDYDSHWLVQEWDLGTTEGGSSGAPLFNEKHQVVGTLTGGEATCDHILNDYFSKMSMAWDEYADPSDQLKHWLDPDGTGLEAINGYDPYYGVNLPEVAFSASDRVITSGSSIQFTDLSDGNPVAWEWWFAGANTYHTTDQHPIDIVYSYPGEFDVLLKVSNAHGTQTKLLKNYITVISDCINYTNLEDNEAYTLEDFDTAHWGYVSGHNSFEFSEFAEKFTTTASYIQSFDILPAKVYSGIGSATLKLKIWGDGGKPGDVLYSSTLDYSVFTEEEWYTVELATPVFVYGSYFVGYQIAYANSDTFAMAHAPHRGSSGKNTTMVRKNNVWVQVGEFGSEWNISLAIEPKVCTTNSLIGNGQDPSLTLFPNPVFDQLFVDVPYQSEKEMLVSVMSIYGQLVYLERHQIIDQQLQLNLSSLKPGVYVLKVEDTSNSFSERFLKL